MNEAKESLRSIEQKYKLFQQQQFTFIAALEHCRENAHDKIRPIASIGQVQSYTEHYCNNSTDRRILLMFLDICSELNKLCQHFEALHSGTPVTNNLLEKCKSLVSQSNDLSNLRAKYPHDVVNHLSCDEARNHYGGVVSLIPIVLDLMKEWIAHSEKLPRKALQHVSESQARQEAIGAAATHPSWTTGTQPRLRKHKRRQLTKDSPKPRRNDKGCSKPPWRPPGGKL
ncbi:sperm acrosome-associated protein 9 isoform 1-T11 [Lycaon pictus]|uniref:Sperm acrosome associated 9 n=3 Tax=Canis lupus TaxID=9612 RepID=A0A8C0NX17_CANLF|nr:sperm acrosome-associated protein 9 isoform X1 [Canis lupus familiaris]XP_022279369.1 sperm acrosome-associated protein 9 isoform X1 [Canis lupus familiaris]XP_022279370.1 sperm acrosome-associated protein 9 isoform X1 [Canis lupus familiaris]XP_022279371.1 sperm acrosome-associated protein 9 isoform X1 [Canis lupus familiaris]XP_022279372.1 sperm acrosome-associated protein 9 isoform X1 [Canis lupus familiaris]XP_022279373.1 sperm acrosome-associated protein 9 isoform X1 [Canis lupus famil|eukprot:XP_022279368.1 sperm acrosome-associated protein 9 isoform X1 [Canis lupus familiaris]